MMRTLSIATFQTQAGGTKIRTPTQLVIQRGASSDADPCKNGATCTASAVATTHARVRACGRATIVRK
eukprot:COSAG01_NODE_5874_length_3978_cov_2.018041_2_plen_68_part_00